MVSEMRTQNKCLFVGLVVLSLTLLVVGIPGALSPRNMWDGAGISFAFETQDFRGIEERFLAQSSWKYQTYFLRVQNLVVQRLDYSYSFVDLLLQYVAFSILLLALYTVSRKYFAFSQLVSLLTTALLAVFPVWSVLLSTVMTYHLVMLALGVVSILLIHKAIIWQNILGFLSLPIAFGLNSLILFLPVLSYTLDLLSAKRLRWPTVKTCICLMISVIFYVQSNVLGPLIRTETDINRPLSPFSRNSYELYLKSGEAFAKFLLPLLLVSMVGLCFAVFNRRSRVGLQHDFLKSSLTSFISLRILVSSSLVFASSLPYIFVGKHPAVFDVEWGSRHGWVFSFAVALLAASLITAIFTDKRGQSISFLALIVIFLVLSTLQFGAKLERQFFENDLKPILAKISDANAKGLVTIYGAGIPVPHLRDFESNYLWYETTGQSDSFVRVSDFLNDSPLIFTGKHGGIDTVYTGPLEPNCVIKVQIAAEGYGPLNDGEPYRVQMQRLVSSFFKEKAILLDDLALYCNKS